MNDKEIFEMLEEEYKVIKIEKQLENKIKPKVNKNDRDRPKPVSV